ncbi:MAG: DNA-processing protein DprA [Candidatus Omnitrophica bacterium]|nr:DNA-processing protein DprA [Candidatus Omnitrophota bacterium]
MKELAILFNKAGVSFTKFQEVAAGNRDLLRTVQDKDAWGEFPFLTEKERERLKGLQRQDFVKNELQRAQESNVQIIDFYSEEYPQLLREIPHPPVVLYVQGSPAVISKLCIGIVGTRLPTFYGIEMAKKFSYALASLGLIVVSGLARGIDTAAHLGALAGGDTIAVLGCGLNYRYPKENESLAARISERGAVISEFALEERPRREYFPRRNRIISGVSRGVLVVQAADRSGALITARYALEQNREVFALPGDVNSSKSRGTNKLIKQGAKLVDSVEDILQELPYDFSRPGNALSLSDEEKGVFDIITEGGISLEEMLLRYQLKRDIINKVVLSLQIKGLIKEAKPLYYVKAQL